MRLKQLAAAATCVAALGAAGATPAVAKNDKHKLRNCHSRKADQFLCNTDNGGTATVRCPSGYDLTAIVMVSDPTADVNGNEVVCSGPLGVVDDTPLS